MEFLKKGKLKIIDNHFSTIKKIRGKFELMNKSPCENVFAGTQPMIVPTTNKLHLWFKVFVCQNCMMYDSYH